MSAASKIADGLRQAISISQVTNATPCPLGDGRHQLKPWADQSRSGFACRACSKTWEWRGDTLVSTYSML